MKNFKFLSKTPIYIQYLPTDHYLLDVGPEMYEPRTLERVRFIYYKHIDPNQEEVFKKLIDEQHPLYHWQEHN